MYTRTTPTRIEYLATLWADGFDPSYAYRDGRSCGLALARADGNALDAFCRNSAFVVALRGEAEETRPQAADYIANWRPDHFNNHVPKFPSPSELLASPDGKHAYLFDEGTSAILHFERIGNALPEGDAAPDVATQSCDFGGCPTRSNSSARPHEPE